MAAFEAINLGLNKIFLEDLFKNYDDKQVMTIGYRVAQYV